MKTERNDYSRMKRKVFMQLVIMLVMSGIAVLLLYNFLQGKIGVYIIKLSTRKLYDESGQVHYCIDETLRRRLETKLITKILAFEVA